MWRGMLWTSRAFQLINLNPSDKFWLFGICLSKTPRIKLYWVSCPPLIMKLFWHGRILKYLARVKRSCIISLCSKDLVQNWFQMAPSTQVVQRIYYTESKIPTTILPCFINFKILTDVMHTSNWTQKTNLGWKKSHSWWRSILSRKQKNQQISPSHSTTCPINGLE